MAVLGEHVLDDCHVPSHLESASDSEDVAQVRVLISGRLLVRALAWSPSVAPLGGIGILLGVFGSRSFLLVVSCKEI